MELTDMLRKILKWLGFVLAVLILVIDTFLFAVFLAHLHYAAVDIVRAVVLVSIAVAASYYISWVLGIRRRARTIPMTERLRMLRRTAVGAAVIAISINLLLLAMGRYAPVLHVHPVTRGPAAEQH